jgi:hypothetical protein
MKRTELYSELMVIILKSCNAARITRKNNLDLRGHLSEMVGAFLLEFSARFSQKHKNFHRLAMGLVDET